MSSPAKLAAWTGIPAALGYTPLNKGGDTATNLLLAFSSYRDQQRGLSGRAGQRAGRRLHPAGQRRRQAGARLIISAATTYTVPPEQPSRYGDR